MITRFWWVRHGPTHAKAAIGWTDLPADLSDTAALDRLSAYLPQKATLISSDLQRARATADAIQNARPRLAHTRDLREMHFGEWEGMPFADIAKRDPEISRKFWENPGKTAAPNGESWDMLSTRISGAVDDLTNAHSAKDIIIVTHFATILTALQRASNMSARAAFSFKIDNLSVTRLDYLHDTKSWRVMGVNHLV
ncbi:MAG: histidine phosphatase family protein [Paracoccaceae bacterium]